MDFQAIFENFRRTVADHYFDMNGRVGRAQYWYFVAAYIAFAILAALLASVTFLPLREIYFLGMLLPTAAMSARRLQDTGRDGKLVWIFIVAGFVSQICSLVMAASFLALGFLSFFLFGPSLILVNLALLVACIVLIYFCCQPGDAGDNAYGPPPPVFNPSARISPSP